MKVDSLPLPGIPQKRGRPVTGQALSGAERVRRYREHKKLAGEKLSCSAEELFLGNSDVEVLEWFSSGSRGMKLKAWIELGRRYGFKMPLP